MNQPPTSLTCRPRAIALSAIVSTTCVVSATPTLRPVVALLAGLSLSGWAAAQMTPATDAGEPTAAVGSDAVMPAVRARAKVEATGKDSVRATTTTTAKGQQELRDVPQSITVVTERLIDDRNLDTLKDALKNASGVSFLAAEGGEEDIRLRGFSLQASGDIFIDGMRDPAYYERDSFNWDRLEVLRGSASMLFGRGSTGGAVNQVSKKPMLMTQHEVAFTIGTGAYLRGLGDFIFKTGEDAALRVNVMSTLADEWGVKTDKRGIAPAFRRGIGTRDEFSVGAYFLDNDNGIHYGLPWLTPGTTKGGDYLWPTSPRNYYGMASDFNHTGTTQFGGSHVHRFSPSDELRTQLRVGRYDRDQRASAVRFAPAALQPGGQAVTADTFNEATQLTRGSNLKKMALDTAYLQSDYSGRQRWFGLDQTVQAGVDLAREKFENYAFTLPAGVTIVKPRTTVGTPDDGAWVDESLRIATVNRSFDSKGLGAYAQDLLQIAPMWKLLGGLRWDRLEGDYHAITAQGQPTVGNPPVANPCYTPADTRYTRDDSLWSKRLGLLFQPSPQQSFHFSYGTSFNTSGDTYQYDAGTSETPPEESRNLELGARLDAADGRVTTRLALFHSTKHNERNRDADTVNACNYVLSGKRHAAGFELDVAGRITPAWEVYASYSWIPIAEVDSSSGAAGTEAVGSRPGLTPRHSGTVWSTYQLAPRWRAGGGFNLRSSETPQGLPAGSLIEVPGYLTADLMAEYTQRDLGIKANLINLTDEHYAGYLYRGHYVPGKGRTLQLTVAYKFY